MKEDLVMKVLGEKSLSSKVIVGLKILFIIISIIVLLQAMLTKVRVLYKRILNLHLSKIKNKDFCFQKSFCLFNFSCG